MAETDLDTGDIELKYMKNEEKKNAASRRLDDISVN